MSNRRKPRRPTVPPRLAAWRAQILAERAGHHGVNAYTCDTCGLNTVTIDVDLGVTPMFLACRRTPGCKGRGVSAGYPKADPPAELLAHLDWEWYLADPAHELLALRPRTDRPSAYRLGLPAGASTKGDES